MSVPRDFAYLDHAASAPLRPVVRERLLQALDQVGNPSSLHTPGRGARRILEESRETIAGISGVVPADVIFTSGGTEANNLALKGRYWQIVRHSPQRRRIIIGATEHPSIIAPANWLAIRQGAKVEVASVELDGRIDISAFKEMLVDSSDVALVAIMAANNETGVIAPLDDIAEICQRANVPWHCDAVQLAPWLELLRLAGADDISISISGHKLGGPVGCGALIGLDSDLLDPLIHGGGQERGVRAGTSPTALVASLAAAVSASCADRVERSARVRQLRDGFVAAVSEAVPEAFCLTPIDARGLPGHALICFPGADADSLLLLLDAAGIAASAGSACSAGLARTSPVLIAMGVERELAKSAIRFSFGWNSTIADADRVVAVLGGAVEKARAVSRSRIGPAR